MSLASRIVRCGQTASGQDTPLAQVLDTLRSEDVVVPLPRELGFHKALGGKALHGLDDLQVGDVKILVLGSIVVLLGDQDTLCSEISDIASGVITSQFAPSKRFS